MVHKPYEMDRVGDKEGSTEEYILVPKRIVDGLVAEVARLKALARPSSSPSDGSKG